MDPITHGLLGASVSQTINTKAASKNIIIVGALAAMAADLDIFWFNPHNPTISMLYHRQATHALIFILLGGLIVGGAGLLFFSTLRNRWHYVLLTAIAAYATHGLLDACTSYGTQLFWPFTNKRIAWDIISIVDPLFTGILAIGVYVGYKKHRPLATIICLLLALGYLLFGTYQHQRATFIQKRLAEGRNQAIIRARVLPEFGNLWHFRSIYLSDKQIYLDRINTSWFQPAYAEKFFPVPLFTADMLPTTVTTNRLLLQDFRIFIWFTDGYLTAVNNSPLTTVDLRYVVGKKSLTAMWGIRVPENEQRQHVRLLRWLPIAPGG